MKYKVGDKFLVEITGCNNSCYPYELNDIGIIMAEEGLDKLRRPDDMTAEEAWEIAKKLFADFKKSELDEIFGKNWSYPKLMELSPQEAKSKIEAWEAKEKEIKVGDIVYNIDNPDVKVMITKCYGNGCYDGINTRGATYSNMSARYWIKTGRHVDIQSILGQIGGAD